MAQRTLTPLPTLGRFDARSTTLPCPHSGTYGVDFTIERTSASTADATLSAAWNTLLHNSPSPEAIFQTPEYFEFISQAPNKKNYQELVLVRETSSQNVIGVVPIRTGRRTLPLQVGSRTIGRLRVQTIVLLGSIPLVLQQQNIWDTLLTFLFKEFPGHEAIAMQSLPIDSDFYRHLKTSPNIRNNYRLYIKDGWRVCHVTPLPSTIEGYRSQFKSKKRYNLNRQLKLLEKNLGILNLHRINTDDDISALMYAARQIASDYVVDNMMDTDKYKELARQKMLLCYILSCGGRACGIIMGIRFKNTYHIHNIIYDLDLSKYSPGTSILHLATEDLIQHLNISLIDFGYGSPEYANPTADNSMRRGHAFLYRRTWRNHMLFTTYAGFSVAVRWGKQMLTMRHHHAAGRTKITNAS
jgi:hypothetical protein